MPQPHLRAADSDREAVATALGRHMADGRLTVAEYDERLTRAYAARTYGELAEVTADLPPLPAVRLEPRAVAPVRAGACTPAAGPQDPEQAWRAWLSTSVIVLVVYLAVSLARWDLGYFWPMWVIGPWGAVMLAQRITGAPVHGRRTAR